jgi:transcription elongation factor Elf1
VLREAAEGRVKKEKKDFDTDYQQNITCPYCGYVDGDSWEVQFEANEEAQLECCDCEKKFTVIRNVSVDYSSYKAARKKK